MINNIFLIFIFLTFFSCKNDKEIKREDKIERVNDSIRVRYIKDSLIYQESYYNWEYEDSVYTRIIYNTDTLEQYLKSHIKELNLYYLERYKNHKLSIKGMALLNKAKDSSGIYRDPIKIFWNTIYKENGETKESVFSYYNDQGIIYPNQVMKYNNNKIIKDSSHYFYFAIEDDNLVVTLNSPYVKAKKLFLSPKNDENFKEFDSETFNKWIINKDDIKSDFVGYVELDRPLFIESKKLNKSDFNKTYFLETIQFIQSIN